MAMKALDFSTNQKEIVKLTAIEIEIGTWETREWPAAEWFFGARLTVTTFDQFKSV